MAWYEGTFSCGHEGRVNVVGPQKERQWKIERKFNNLCEDCYKSYLEEERERKQREAQEKGKEMELPELNGTTKQINWAIVLRQEFMEVVEILPKKLIEYENMGFDTEGLDSYVIHEVADWIVTTKTNATYWINKRYDKVLDIILEERKNALKTDSEKLEEILVHDLRLEATVIPENQIASGIVEITVKEDCVSAKYEKNWDFIEIVKDLNYTWKDGQWKKEIWEIVGTASDRAAELGNKLLNAGFSVMILEEEIRNMAINGTYEPQHDRWIVARKKEFEEGKLVLRWEIRSKSLYEASRKLPGSTWNKGTVVKLDYYREIQEFAELYDFKITQKAQAALDEYRNTIEKIENTIPAKKEEKQYKDGLKNILDSSNDILNDLKDD